MCPPQVRNERRRLARPLPQVGSPYPTCNGSGSCQRCAHGALSSPFDFLQSNQEMEAQTSVNFCTNLAVPARYRAPRSEAGFLATNKFLAGSVQREWADMKYRKVACFSREVARPV